MRVASLWQCLALGSLFDYAAAIPASGVSQGKTSTITTRQDFQFALNYSSAAPGTPVKPGTKLRILCIGDSITVGVGSSHGNAWRARLRENLSSKMTST
jgi:lysophospholipase L1-like esterase